MAREFYGVHPPVRDHTGEQCPVDRRCRRALIPERHIPADECCLAGSAVLSAAELTVMFAVLDFALLDLESDFREE